MAIKMIAEGNKYLNRTCRECLAFLWSDNGVQGIVPKTSRKPYRSVQACLEAGATPTARIPLTLTPCHECPKVPDSTPTKMMPGALANIVNRSVAEEISERTYQVIQHFEECDAVHHFPDDPIVKKHAALIRRLRDDAKRAEHNKGVAYLMSVLTLGGGR